VSGQSPLRCKAIMVNQNSIYYLMLRSNARNARFISLFRRF
jgi:hypothetical protein